MKRIFLAPRADETSYEHFKSTIISGRTYSFLESYLNDEEKKILSKYKTISVWGNKESLKSRWDKMHPGDYVLFYKKGIFYYSATVITTKFSNELGEKLWPRGKDGKIWNCLFFVDNLREINIPIKVVQELAGYKPKWDRVMGFMPLSDKGIKTIQEQFGTIDNFIIQDQNALISRVIAKTEEKIKKEITRISTSGRIFVPQKLSEAEFEKLVYEVDNTKRERALQIHQDLILYIIENFKGKNFEGKENKHVDLSYFSPIKNKVLLFEMKSASNEKTARMQARQAVGQLLEYEYYDIKNMFPIKEDTHIVKVLVMNTLPSEDYIKYLNNLKIYTIQVKGDKVILAEKDKDILSLK